MNLTSFLQEKQLTILLRGEIDHHTSKETIAQIRAKIDSYLPQVCILDFEEVGFMDSSGIAVVINTIRHMREVGGRLLLQNIPPQPLRVLRTAGIEKIAELHERSEQHG